MKRIIANKIDDLNFELKIIQNGKEKNINVVSLDETSRYGIKEITVDDELYDLKDSVPKIDLFFDIGANIGLSTIWANHFFPKAKIIAVEPGKELVEIYNKNTSYIGRETIQLHNKAACSKKGEIEFFFSDVHNGVSTTSDWMVGDKHSNSYKVPALNIFKLIKKNARNFKKENVMMKMDIEGGEYSILQNKKFAKFFNKYIGYLMIELHGDLQKQINQYEELKQIIGEHNLAVEILSPSPLLNYNKPFSVDCWMTEYKKYLFEKNIKIK